jgi:hypothetical protein
VLIGADYGLFLARAVNGAVAVDPAGKIDTGHVMTMHDFPGSEVLFWAIKGWFLACLVNGEVVVRPLGAGEPGRMRDLPGAGVLIDSSNGVFVAVQTPLSPADCIPR